MYNLFKEISSVLDKSKIFIEFCIKDLLIPLKVLLIQLDNSFISVIFRLFLNSSKLEISKKFCLSLVG